MAKRVNRKRSKRYGKKKMQYGGRKKGLRQPIQYFKRSVWLPGLVTTSTTGITGQGLSFALVDVPNSSEFTALYDQYKIQAVKVKIMPRFNSVDLTLGGGRVHSVIDYDDSINPTSMAELLQYQNLKTTGVGRIHSRYLKPMINVSSQSGAQLPQRKPWIDCSTNSTAYRGLKLIFDQTSSAVLYDAMFTYYLAFKNVR